MTTDITFESVAARMIAAHDGVAEGRMMSHPAIAYRGKVFAFPGRGGDMVFRLGKDFDPDAAGLTGCSHLSPFKNKPPMKGWVCVPPDQAARWTELAEAALDVMRAEVGA